MYIKDNLYIDEKELSESFIRSSGPGGQNVNKVETAVQLRFDVVHSPSLPEDIRNRLIMILGSRLTKDGVLVITAQRFRTQDRNRQDARARLVGLVLRAIAPPVKRIPTKPTRSSKEARLSEKIHRGRIKQGRRGEHEAE